MRIDISVLNSYCYTKNKFISEWNKEKNIMLFMERKFWTRYIIIVTICHIVAEATKYERVIVKPNFGVSFEKVMTFDAISNNWTHIIAVPLPQQQEITFLNRTNCQDEDTTNNNDRDQIRTLTACSNWNYLEDIYNTMREQLMAVMKRQRETLKSFLLHPTTRGKRSTSMDYGLYPTPMASGAFYWKGSNTVPSETAASMEEFQRIYNQNLDTIQGGLYTLADDLQTTKNELISLTAVSDIRIQKLWESLNTTFTLMQSIETVREQDAKNMLQKLNQLSRKNREMLSILRESQLSMVYFHSLNVRDLHILQLMVQESEAFISALIRSRDGYLSPYFASIKDLRGIIANVSRTLHDHFPIYRLVYTEPETYFTLQNTFSVKKGEFLFITLRLPLKDLAVHTRCFR